MVESGVVETVSQRMERVRELERSRSQRRAQLPDGPVEVAPGRGDLRFASTSLYSSDTLEQPTIGWPTDWTTLIGRKPVSYALLMSEQPWVGAAVLRMLMWAIRVPLKAYRREGDDSRVRLRPGEHPIADAITTPWDRGSQGGLLQNLLGPMLVHGTSVTVVDDGAGGKLQFDPKDWRFIDPIIPWRGALEGFRVDVDQPKFTRSVSIDQVLMCCWWSPLSMFGISPLSMLGTTIRVEDAAQRWQQAMMLNAGRPPSGIIASEEFLGLDATERNQLMAQLRADLTTIYAGPENAGKPALLPPGLDWKAIGHSANEAALIDQRKVAREEVCAVYMIPPPMLGILDRATYSNVEVQKEMIYTDAVGPPLVLIEQAINAQIVKALLREDDVYVEFDFGHVLRGSRLDEINALRGAIGTALLTPNEGRAALNQPHSSEDGMDTFYLPMNNLQPVGTPPQPAVTVPAPGKPAVPGDPVKASDYELELP
jgi:HK97 family phage portal protein